MDADGGLSKDATNEAGAEYGTGKKFPSSMVITPV